MSYPYDSNPWDDNYDQNAQQPQQQPTGFGTANYAVDGYSNPMAQYSSQETSFPRYEAQLQKPPQGEAQEQPASGTGEQQDGEGSWPSQLVRRLLPCCSDCLAGCRKIFDLPFINSIAQKINKDLLVSKIFYFFFYSAFGSLFPLMGVYFKQLGMNPAQVGILTGVRPFIEIFSAPFWHSLAGRFHKSKALLIFSLLSWIIFTYSLAHIRPPASACVAFNDTDYVLYTPYSANDLSNYEVGPQAEEATTSSSNEMFLNKMPQEGKENILASEENQNAQRRRKREVSLANFVMEAIGEARDRYAYPVVSQVADGIDGRADEDIQLHDEYVDERIATRGRYLVKRSLEMREADEVLGESDQSEQPDEEESAAGKSRDGEQGEDSDSAEQPGDDEAVNSPNKQGDRQVGQPSTTMATAEPSESSHDTERAPTAAPVNKTKRVYRQRHKTPPTHIVGMSPITVEYAVNYNKDKHSQFVTPMFSTIVYKLDDIKEVFFLLLLLISLGEFFSAPALTLADSATLSYLGDNTDAYGRQRMFGSLSWAITLLLVGMALDNATAIADHPCGPHYRERSYTVCFIIFSLLMACALVTATQFKFNYLKGDSGQSQATLVASTTTDGSNKVITTTVDGSLSGNIDDLYASTQPRSIFNTAPPVNAPPPQHTDSHPMGKEKFEFLDKMKSAVFAQNTWELPEWVNVFRQFRNSLHLMYLFITWFLGCGVGLVFTFLFWHLQDVGGTPTLFGICSVINHISEILAYFFSFSFIKRFGHTRVLSVGLGCNVIRFLYVAFLTNPYYALPFELVQGITHAACFAACCSYISHVSKPELRTSTQGVMQGLHHGIGRACGALLGGYMINAIGSSASFCIYGLLNGCVLAGFLHIRKKASQLEEEEFKVDDNEALGGYGAPQGVPSAIPGKITTQTAAASSSPQDYDYQW